MVDFGSSRPVTIVRGAGTLEELRWETRMGGNFDTKALFQADDRVVTGDEIHCDVFDQPRIVLRVKPVLASGVVTYWDAAIAPCSESSRHRKIVPSEPLFQLHLGSKTPSVIGPDVRSDPAALSPGREFPRFVYHVAQAPRMVSSKREEVELGPEWSRVYIHQRYPCFKYHWTKPPVTVKDVEEERALGGGWANSPAPFEPYKGARPARTEQQDPTKWLEEWSVPGLSPDHKKKIKAQLLRADGAFDRSPDPDSAALASMRQAFDGIARVLFDAGILTEQLLKNEIPLFVWDSAIAGAWWRLASESRQDIFPEQLGHYWVWRDDGRDWKGLFRAEVGEWCATLLDAPSRSPEVADRNAPTRPEQSGSPHRPKVSSIAARRGLVLRLQALKFALRQVFQEGQMARLKSWEEVREDLLSIASDESVPLDLRTKIGDELNPQDEALRSLLNSASSERRREGGRIVVDRVLEPSEVTRFRTSPEHRDQVISESYQNQTAQAFDEIERQDPVFFSYIIQTAHRANKTKLKQPAATKVSRSREEQHDLLRRFSADHLGLSSSELESVLRRDQWRQRCLSWLVKQDLRVRGARGAPKKAQAEMTRARWEEIGKPQLTAEVRDRLAEFSYPTEFARAKLYSKERKKLRDRVAKQVKPLINKAAPAAPAT